MILLVTALALYVRVPSGHYPLVDRMTPKGYNNNTTTNDMFNFTRRPFIEAYRDQHFFAMNANSNILYYAIVDSCDRNHQAANWQVDDEDNLAWKKD